MNAIAAAGLKKTYGRVRAVDGVDLEVPRGAVFGLIGENGAGKTTFIKLLLGIALPGEGRIEVLGGRPSDPRVRERIGYLPERLTLPAAFTPVAFLRSIGRLKGLDRPGIEDGVPRALEQVGLDPAAWTRKMGGFSKGMRQRTGLAAALLGGPDLLVLDEPTDGIDPIGRAQIRRVIATAARAGATVFLNSHLLAETEKLCDHVAVMARGRVVLSGSIDALRAEDAFTVRFADPAAETDDDADTGAHEVGAIAARHGFVPAEEPGEDGASFVLRGQDAAGLSEALKGALADGLHVVEVHRKLKDLETVLEEAVVNDVGGPGTGPA